MNANLNSTLMVVQELRDSFKLNYYILVSRVFTDPSAPAAMLKKKQKAVSIATTTDAAKEQLDNVLSLITNAGESTAACDSLCST